MNKNDKPFEIILFGPPASGKGTQAQLLSQTFEIPHISTGDLLRAVKSDPSNPLGQKIAELIDNGQLVSDEMISQMVLEKIRLPDCQVGYVLDGYPRTQAQVDFLESKADIDYVFLIDVPDEVVVDRVAGRRMCKNGHSWHIKYSPTKVEGICDICGEKLYQRDDDNEEKVKERLRIYHDNTDGILKFYEDKKQLIKVNGDQLIEKVFQNVIKFLVDDLRQKSLSNSS